MWILLYYSGVSNEGTHHGSSEGGAADRRCRRCGRFGAESAVLRVLQRRMYHRCLCRMGRLQADAAGRFADDFSHLLDQQGGSGRCADPADRGGTPFSRPAGGGSLAAVREERQGAYACSPPAQPLLRTAAAFPGAEELRTGRRLAVHDPGDRGVGARLGTRHPDPLSVAHLRLGDGGTDSENYRKEIPRLCQ